MKRFAFKASPLSSWLGVLFLVAFLGTPSSFSFSCSHGHKEVACVEEEELQLQHLTCMKLKLLDSNIQNMFNKLLGTTICSTSNETRTSDSIIITCLLKISVL